MLASSSNVDEMSWGYIAGLAMVVGLHYDFLFSFSFLFFLACILYILRYHLGH